VTRRLIGIDEAGRGPVLGPLVMAVVVLAPEQERRLLDAGVRDSKLFGSGPKAHRDRTALRPLIEDASVRWHVEEFSPSVVDSYCSRGRLDDLEREGALKLLQAIGATSEDHIVCDGAPIFGSLTTTWPNLVAENKADARHVTVAAASVLAKIRREECMGEIFSRYSEDFGKIGGGGYVNEQTRRFLEAYEAKHGELPPETRRSWTWRRPIQTPNEWPDILGMLSDV
jgi:ribonuclease HII